MWMIAAAGSGAPVDIGGPWRGVSGVVGETGERRAQAVIAGPAEDDAAALARGVGDRTGAGFGGELVGGGEALADVAELGEDLGRADAAGAREGHDDLAVRRVGDGLLDRQIPKIRRIYGQPCDVMLAALERAMPAGARWTRPEGGMFLWVTLPEGFNSADLLQRAVERQVAFVPGAAFHANGGGENTMRLNFSHAAPERIEEGVRRLSEVIAEATR